MFHPSVGFPSFCATKAPAQLTIYTKSEGARKHMSKVCTQKVEDMCSAWKYCTQTHVSIAHRKSGKYVHAYVQTLQVPLFANKPQCWQTLRLAHKRIFRCIINWNVCVYIHFCCLCICWCFMDGLANPSVTSPQSVLLLKRLCPHHQLPSSKKTTK